MRSLTRGLLLLALWGLAVQEVSSQEQNLVVKVLQTAQFFDSARSGDVESRLNCSIVVPTSSPAAEKSDSRMANVPWVSNSYPGLGMDCTSQGQSAGWRHVVNTVLVVASDGNAYALACEAAFRWSKCKGLQSGDFFRASPTAQGLRVYAADPNGKATEIDFRVLSSKSLKPQQAQNPSTSEPAKPQTSKGQASGTGTVTVLCAETGAEIYVDGKFVGNPPVMLDLPEGPHTFEVKADGYSDWQRNLDVLKNSAVTLNVTLAEAR